MRRGQPWVPRLAVEEDIPQIAELIALSARELQAGDYSAAQIEAALGPVFGVDRQLILDGTYFVVVAGNELAGCGGWSLRRSLYGGNDGLSEPGPSLNPASDAARIRAFFTNPAYARTGVATVILAACEAAIIAAGFRRIELAATLTGQPFYSAFGYRVQDRCTIALPGCEPMPSVRMGKLLTGRFINTAVDL